MNVTEQINNFVRLNGGNERDALNVALTRLDLANAHALRLMQERDEQREAARLAFKHRQKVESERDEARRQLSEAQIAIDVLSQTIVAQNNEIKRLSQQREDVAEYRAEIARLNQAATA